MMPQPATPESALRLDLNEHTGGCAPEVAAALQALTATQLACYPDTAALTRAVAARFSVQPDEVLLTNGLDEGILVAAIACLGLRPHAALRQSAELGSPDARREMIVVTPVFDPYLQAAAAMQADAVIVPAGPDFQFPRQAVLDAITPQTRLIILNTPHNPTGSEIPIRAIAEVCAAAPHALVLVDEAYQDFGQTSCISALPSWPNAIVGRTFSKAYGLAGLRIGALIGAPALLAPMKQATPVFTLSTPAVTALETALQHDFEVETCAPGLEALLAIGEQRPDVVIVDLHMPGVDAPLLVEALSGAGELLGEVRVVALVAHDEGLPAARRGGAHLALSKGRVAAGELHPLLVKLVSEHQRRPLLRP